MSIASIRLATSDGNPTSPIEKPSAPATSEPAQVGLRQVLTTELSALLIKETSRRDNDCLTTLKSVRATLLGLERACEAASLKLTENSSASATTVSELVEMFVRTATRDRETAVKNTRAEAQVEISRLEELIAGLKAEAQGDRDQLKVAREEAATQREACARAEAASHEAKIAAGRMAAQVGAQLQAVQVELEAERALVAQLRRQNDTGNAERAKLVAAVQTIQRAVSFADPVGSGETPSWEPLRTPTQHREATDQGKLAPSPIEPAKGARTPSQAEPPTALDRSVGTRQSSEPTLVDPALAACVDRLFTEIERMYHLDLESQQSRVEVVHRLTANLRYAHSVLRQSCNSDTEAAEVLERQIMILIDAKGETSFARHLGIAAHQWASPDNRES